MTTATRLVAELKSNAEDFEFYPTTDEIIQAMLDDISKMDKDAQDESDKREEEYCNRHGHPPQYYGRFRADKVDVSSILDIGAGHGKVLRAFSAWCAGRGNAKPTLMAIEKSQTLIRELTKDALVIGTDLHAQNLLGKQAGVVFSNPPYSEYDQWAAKIIRECSFEVCYLVIPQRWVNSQIIADALAFRPVDTHIVGEFSFEDAEDRKARAKVSLVRLTSSDTPNSLFDAFFSAQFGAMEQAAKKSQEQSKESHKERRQTLITRAGLVGALVELYNDELDRIRSNYEKVADIDPHILGEFGVTASSIRDGLKNKLDNLRCVYWRELFTNMTEITKRLTRVNRQSMLDRLDKTMCVDFSAANVYAILCWVLDRAHEYEDSQIVGVFNDLMNATNVKLYKSNARVLTAGDWRYGCRVDLTHYALEYRLVVSRCGLSRPSWKKSGSYLSSRGQGMLQDLLCVANILGFDCDPSSPLICESGSDSSLWVSGRSHTFHDRDGRVIVEVKAFLNGNMHIRMGQEFALALNVTMGKLQGWIHNPEEAADELGDPAAAEIFNNNHHVGLQNQCLRIGLVA